MEKNMYKRENGTALGREQKWREPVRRGAAAVRESIVRRL